MHLEPIFTHASRVPGMKIWVGFKKNKLKGGHKILGIGRPGIANYVSFDPVWSKSLRWQASIALAIGFDLADLPDLVVPALL